MVNDDDEEEIGSLDGVVSRRRIPCQIISEKFLKNT
jgi:hypothetical protein